MAWKRVQIFISGVLLTLVLMKPNLPMLAGTVLLALVMVGAGRDLSEPSAKKRWAGFKRMIKASAVGAVLVMAGLVISGDWPAHVSTAAQARHGMFMLAAYCGAVVVTPLMAWQLIAFREPRQKRTVRTKSTTRTLRKMAELETDRRVSMAVRAAV